MHKNLHSTIHARKLKCNHIGKRSTNGGLYTWAKCEFKNKTNHIMRTKCEELEELELELEERAREIEIDVVEEYNQST